MVHFGEARAIGFHPGGVECVRFGWGKIFSCGLDGTIQSWDPATSKVWNRMRMPQDLHALAANGQMLASQPAFTFEVLSERGQLAVGLRHGPVTLLDASSGRPIRGLEFEAEPFCKSTGFCTLATSPDGKHLAGSNRTYTAVWEIDSGNLIWRSRSGEGGNFVTFLGDQVLIQQWQPHVLVAQWKAERPFGQAPWQGLHGQLVTSQMAPSGAEVDMVFSALEVATKPRAALAVADIEAATGPHAEQDLEVDLDGSWDGSLAVSAEVAASISAGAEASGSSARSGYCLLGLSLKRSQIIWRAETSSRVHALGFLPDGKHLLAASSAGQIEIWKIGDQKPLTAIDLSEAPLLAAAKGYRRRDGQTTPVPWLEEDFFDPQAAHSICLSPDVRNLAIGTAGGAVLATTLES